MLSLNTDIFAQVVADAKVKAANSPRWLNAIERAARELAENPYIERDDDHLLLASPSGKTYSANGVCQCEAYQHGKPCWHRAAGRLVQRYDEALAAQDAPPASWPRELATGKPMDWYAAKRAVETGAAMVEKRDAARKATAAMNELFA